MPQESLSTPLSAPPVRHVFVYGTLRRGGSNDITRLSPAPCWVGEACLPGMLFTLGLYPGMRLQGQAAEDLPVRGEVYAITTELERVLDRIEGLVEGALPAEADEYARREAWVQVGGRDVFCLVYEIHARFAQPHARLLHGDWLKDVG